MNTQLKITKPLVSVQWLFDNLNAPNLVILDATIPKVGQSAQNLNTKEGIKEALFFDIKNVFSEKNAPFPNTIVSPEVFEYETRKMGINNDSAIIIYDKHGVYSSPRAWWLFKAMGHKNVAVLDGGFPQWKRVHYPSGKINDYKGESGNFKANYQPNSIFNYHNVLEALSNEDNLILDARSEDRFKGIKPEPREGLRSGHIPNSKNLPFTELVKDGKMLPNSELFEKFNDYSSAPSKMIFSCGSGVTACILALGAEISGHKNISVYDGSWTEWGSLTELPIESD